MSYETALDAAKAFVDPALHHLLTDSVQQEDFSGALVLTDSQYCVPLFLALWPIIPAMMRPKMLGEAVSGGDAPWRYLDGLYDALELLQGRVFDEGAAAAFDCLPAMLTVYRGTVMRETENDWLGICWTLKRDTAIWFATKHARFRNLDSPPVLLSADIDRGAAAGYLIERGEDEILIHPDVLDSLAESYTITPL